MDGFPSKYKWQILLAIIGIGFVGIGVYVSNIIDFQTHDVEVLSSATSQDESLIVEVSGAVMNNGVYELSPNARVEDALEAAGGLASDADLKWVSQVINRAAKVNDGQKIYIPSANEQSGGGSANVSSGYQTGSGTNSVSLGVLVSINTSSASELEVLWGIGPKTAQNIIEQRPYSSVEELLQKGILKQNVYQTNKDKLTIY